MRYAQSAICSYTFVLFFLFLLTFPFSSTTLPAQIRKYQGVDKLIETAKRLAWQRNLLHGSFSVRGHGLCPYALVLLRLVLSGRRPAVEVQEMEILRYFDRSAELKTGFFAQEEFWSGREGRVLLSLYLISSIFNGSATYA
jgi:hypothetical protein